MAFSPQKTLLLLERDLLKEFLIEYGIKLPNPKADTNIQPLYELLQKEEKFEEIESRLRDIHEMSHEQAIERIIAFAKNESIHLPEAFYDCENNECKALWILLNHKELFYEVFLWDNLQDYGSQYNLKTKEILTPDFFSEAMLVNLEIAFQKEFKAEGKAQNCKVMKSYNKETNTLCLSIYFDDFSKSEPGFKRSQFVRIPRKPVKELHFLVFLDDRKVALQFSRARYKRKAELLKLFLKTTLKEEFDENEFRTLTLDPLADKNFALKMPPEERSLLEFFRVKTLRFDKYIYNKGVRVTLDVKDEENKDDIYNQMESLRINPEIYKVTQAIVQFKFRDMGKRGSVTTTLTLPNSDNLQDSDLHKKCRKYLKMSGIMH